MALNLKLDLKNINLEFILKLSLKIKIAVVAGVIVVILGLYGGLLAYPNYKNVVTLKQDIAQLTIKRDEKKKDASNLPKLKEEVQRLEKELRYSMTVLPNTDEIPTIVRAVENNLRKYNLEILSFKPDREIKKDFYAEIPISLRFSGTFREVGEFSQTISRYPRIINITNLIIKNLKQTDAKVTLSVESKAITYRFLNPDEIVVPKKDDTKGGKKK